MSTQPPRSGPPRRIGPYRIEGWLGQGGMGSVYLGRSREDELVAVKALRQDLTADPGLRSRFAREAAVAKQVNGPYIARLVAADPHDDPPWLATEFVDGPTLDEHIRDRGPMQEASLQALALALLRALDDIHRVGIVHRDLNPSNVLLAPDGPRIVDFGIALDAAATMLTATGATMGTPAWMAPEQVLGEKTTAATDVHAWGAVVTWAATGHRPFREVAAAAAGYQVVHEAPVLDGLPLRFQEAVGQAMAKDPAHRPSTGELRGLLEPARVQALATTSGWAVDIPPRVITPLPEAGASRRVRVSVALGILLLAVGAAAAFVFYREGPPTSAPTGDVASDASAPALVAPAGISEAPPAAPQWSTGRSVPAPVDLEGAAEFLASTGRDDPLGCGLYAPTVLSELGWEPVAPHFTSIGSFNYGWTRDVAFFYVSVWPTDATNGNVDRFFDEDVPTTLYADGSAMRVSGDDRLIEMPGEDCLYELLLEGVPRADLGRALESWSHIRLPTTLAIPAAEPTSTIPPAADPADLASWVSSDGSPPSLSPGENCAGVLGLCLSDPIVRAEQLLGAVENERYGDPEAEIFRQWRRPNLWVTVGENPAEAVSSVSVSTDTDDVAEGVRVNLPGGLVLGQSRLSDVLGLDSTRFFETREDTVQGEGFTIYEYAVHAGPEGTWELSFSVIGEWGLDGPLPFDDFRDSVITGFDAEYS